MKKTIVTKLPAGDIIEIKKLDDGTYEIVQNVPEVSRNIPVSIFKDQETANRVRQLGMKLEFSDDVFVLIEAESLSLEDGFMRYEPRTVSEKSTKELITKAINNRVKNFYKPIYAPSFSADRKGICFAAGKRPAVGKSYRWWADTARNYCPSRNSRLGTRLQYGAFVGVLIKQLVEEGQSVDWAWSTVCNNSRELDNYWNSEDFKVMCRRLSSRCICGYYDFAEYSKILANDEEFSMCWLAGGRGNLSFTFLLDYLGIDLNGIDDLDDSEGWIVLS